MIDIINHYWKNSSWEEILEGMDRAGISQAWTSGIPYLYNKKTAQWEYTDQYDKEILEFAQDHRQILYFTNGFDPTLPATLYIEKQIQQGARGIGELMLREYEPWYLDPTPRIHEKVNSGVMKRICRLANTYNIPILIHADGPYWKEMADLLNYMIDIVGHAPIVIWAHGGRYRWVEHEQHYNTLYAMIRMYPTLYIDMSAWDSWDWVTHYKTLILTHPDRFMIGYDIVSNHAREYPRKREIWDQVLSELPQDLYYPLTEGNAKKVISKVTLS